MHNDEMDLVDLTSICTDFIDESNVSSPERKLLAHLLERAILDLRHSDKYIKKEAEQWFTAQGDNYIFSFENVCSFLDLDSNRIISLIKKWAYNNGVSCSN